MPDERIPRSDPDVNTREQGRGDETFQLEALKAESDLRKLAHKEITQRIFLRWVAVATGLAVIAGMAWILKLVICAALSEPGLAAAASLPPHWLLRPLLQSAPSPSRFLSALSGALKTKTCRMLAAGFPPPCGWRGAVSLAPPAGSPRAWPRGRARRQSAGWRC